MEWACTVCEQEREIIPDPERFTLLREAWQRYSTGAHTLTTLADWLYAQGLRTRGSRRHPGGVRVGEAALHAVLNNPFYYGMMRYKGQLIPGSHEPMTTKHVFDHVNEILHHRGSPHPALKDFTYRGFVFCGECGCMVTAEDKVKFYHGTSRRASTCTTIARDAKGTANSRPYARIRSKRSSLSSYRRS